MSTVAMQCGHTANATSSDGKPACAICVGIHPGATEPGPPSDLTGRTARCAYGGIAVPSNASLPFFEHRPDKPHDLYYCGCFGWD